MSSIFNLILTCTWKYLHFLSFANEMRHIYILDINWNKLILHLIIRMAWGNKHGNVVNTNHCRVISHIHGVSWIMLWYFMRKKFSIYNGDELHPADYLRWLRFMICCWKSVCKIQNICYHILRCKCHTCYEIFSFNHYRYTSVNYTSTFELICIIFLIRTKIAFPSLVTFSSKTSSHING